MPVHSHSLHTRSALAYPQTPSSPVTHANLVPHRTNPHPTKALGPIALIAHSELSYAAPLAFPHPVLAALSVARLGKRSITWRVAVFPLPNDTRLAGRGAFTRAGEGVSFATGSAGGGSEEMEATAAAWGTVVHVFVDREAQRKSVECSEELRRLVEERGLVVVDGEEVAKSWAPLGAEGKEPVKAKL